jgi:hypothetical protein
MIGGIFLLMLIIAFSVYLVVKMTKRDYILKIRKNGDIKVYRRVLSGAIIKLGDKDEYMYTEDCIRPMNGRKSIVVKEGSPGALLWNVDNNKNLSWYFISMESIKALINDEHVKVVANAGQNKISARDILILIGVMASALFSLLACLKLFGIIKGKTAEAVTP